MFSSCFVKARGPQAVLEAADITLWHSKEGDNKIIHSTFSLFIQAAIPIIKGGWACFMHSGHVFTD